MKYFTIESSNYEREINGVMVTYRYWVSVENVFWYSYDDICDFLELNDRTKNYLYENKINDNDKESTYDTNSQDNYNYSRNDLVKWISSNAIHQLIKRNNKRQHVLMKSINNLECVEDAHTTYDEGIELRGRLERAFKAYNEDDYEECFGQMYVMTNTKTVKDTLHKIGLIDIEKENIVDMIREDIYSYDLEEIDEIDLVVTKRKNLDDEEQIKTMYSKRRKSGEKSSCPDWIKNVVK